MLAIAALLLVASCTEASSTGESAETTRSTTVAPQREPATYVVQPSDTLARIARDTGVSLSELVEFNSIADPNVIEVGEVLVLEAVSLPTPNPERSIVSRASTDQSLSARLGDWWDGLYRPDIGLSDESLSQGAVAALMLPAAVLAFVVLWLGWQATRRVALTLSSVGARAFAGGDARLVADGSGGGVGAVDTTSPLPRPSVPPSPSRWSRLRARARLSVSRPPLPSVRLRSLRSARLPSLPSTRFPSTSGERRPLVDRLPSLDLSAVGHRLSRGASSTVGLLRRFTRTPALVSRGIEAKRERSRQMAARQEAEAHWLTGTERLRIGLSDEAHESFSAALRVAREFGWQDEIERNLAALDDIAARRQEGVAPQDSEGAS